MTIANPRALLRAGRETADHAAEVRRSARALGRIDLTCTGVNGGDDLEPLGERVAATADRLSANAAALADVARLFRETDEAQVRSLGSLVPLLPVWE